MLTTTYLTERAAFATELAPLLKRLQLVASWHVDRFDDLLRLLPRAGTSSAGFCVRFEPGFWPAYAAADDLDRDCVHAGTRVQVDIRYDPHRHGRLVRSAATVHPG